MRNTTLTSILLALIPTPRRTRRLLGLCALCSFLAGPPAAAQTRPFFNDLPDLELYTGWLRDEQSASRPYHVGGMFEVSPHTELGTEREISPRLRLVGRLSAALEASPNVFLRADGQLAVPVLLGSDSVEREAGRGIVGRHRIWGRVGIGGTDEGDVGVDVSADYRLEHAPDRAAFRRPTSAPVEHVDQTLDTRLWLRTGMGEGGAWALPLRYEWRRVQVTGSPTIPGFVRHTLGSGFGALGLTPETPQGWSRIVGVNWSRTAFDGGVDCARRDGLDRASCSGGLPARESNGGWAPGGLNQISLRFGQLEDVVIAVDQSALLAARMMLGGSWLWEESGRRQATVFEAGLGLSARFFGDGAGGAIGLSYTRLADHTVDGERIVASNRFELLGEVTLESGMGFSHRAVIDLLSHPESDPDDTKGLPDPVPNTRLHTEWFTALGLVEVGAYHRANYGPRVGDRAVDPWDEGRIWTHELGLFGRIRH